MMKSGKWSIILPGATIILIAIATFFLARDIIFLGDDIAFFLRFKYWEADWKGIPLTMHLHWSEYNGRMADMLSSIPLNLMNANGRGIANALMAVLFFSMPLLIAEFRNLKLLLRMSLIFLMVFTLRWDTIWMENVTTQDYVWTCGYTLMIVALMVRGNLKSDSVLYWLLMPFAMVAGWLHESLGFPLACGLLVYCFSGKAWHRLSPARRGMLIAFSTGAVISPLNPGNFYKYANPVIDLPPEPIWEMLLFSTPYLIILTAIIIFLAIKNRPLLKSLFRTDWVVWCVAAYASSILMIIVGYGGRPGWFAQVFALISIFMVVGKLNIRISRRAELIAGWVMALLIVAHYLTLVIWQHKLSSESHIIIENLAGSKSGIIFHDFTSEKDLPFYLFRKPHAFPDEDDVIYRAHVAALYHRGKHFTVLPVAAASLNFDSLSSPVKFNQKIISPVSLSDKYLPEDKYYPGVRILWLNGEKMVESTFRVGNDQKIIYLYVPFDPDPGCR